MTRIQLYPFLVLGFLLFLGNPLWAQSQNNGLENLESLSKSMQEVFTKVVREATLSKKARGNTCDANTLLVAADAFIKKQEMPVSPDSFIHSFSIQVPIGDLRNVQVERGSFNTGMDKVLYLYQNKSGYLDFVSQLTGQDLGSLDDKTIEHIERAYKTLTYFFDEPNAYYDYDGDMDFTFNGCYVSLQPAFTAQKFKFPNITYKLKVDVAVSCGCNEQSESSDFKVGYFAYEALSKGLFTGTQVTFGDPIAPKMVINKVECCPDTPNDDAPKTQIEPRLDEEYAKLFENYTVDEMDQSEPGDLFKKAQVAYQGKIRLSFDGGLPLGEEADFYGFNWSLEGRYEIRKQGAAFSFGPELGYTQFLGKSTDFGFETENESFVNVKAKGFWDIGSEAPGLDGFAAVIGVGYGFGIGENSEGGVSYDLGAEYHPGKNPSPSATRIFYSLRFKSNTVEGGSFNSVNAGVGITFN